MRVRLNLTLPEDLDTYVRGLAEKNDLNLTTMIQLILMQYKEQHDVMDTFKVAKGVINDD